MDTPCRSATVVVACWSMTCRGERSSGGMYLLREYPKYEHDFTKHTSSRLAKKIRVKRSASNTLSVYGKVRAAAVQNYDENRRAVAMPSPLRDKKLRHMPGGGGKTTTTTAPATTACPEDGNGK